MDQDTALPSLELAGQRLTLQEDIYRQLRNQLMRGAFVPGQSFTVRSIAELVGTSPMPVREALRRLASDRAIEIMPNGTSRARLMTKGQCAEIMEIRMLLEGNAASRAANMVAPEDIARLEVMALENRQALLDRDVVSAARTNQAFHFTLYEAARNPELLLIIENLWVQMGPTLMSFMLKTAESNENLAHLAEAHFDVVEALRKHDPAAAETALRRDLSSIPV